MRKVVSVLLVLAMILTFAGCKKKEVQQETPKIEITVGFALSVTHNITRTDPKPPVVAEWGKDGFIVTFDTYGTFEDYNNVMKARLAARVSLPDLMSVPGQPMEYIPSGVFKEIGNLLGANTKAYFDADGGAVRQLMTAPDGKIYTIPGSIIEDNGGVRNAYSARYILVRRDWMEADGLSDPTNIDEFYQLLKHFQAKGDNVIPFTSSYGCLGLEGLSYLFDVHLTGATGGGFYPNDEGVVEYQWTKPEFYELLKTAAKWYKEGLINPNPVQWNDWAAIQKALADGIGCFELTGTAGADFLNAEAIITDPDAWYEPLTVIESVGGNKFAHPQASGASGYWAVTGNTENVMKFVDYAAYSDKGIMLQWHGVEGIHYTLVNGEVTLTDQVKNHPEGSYSVVYDGGLKGSFPTVVTKAIAYGEQAARGEKTVAMITRNQAEIYPYVIKPYPSIMATKEEAETMARLMADINTYKDEMVVKVFLGEMDIDDMWDEYVKTIKDLGIDEVVAIKQAQLDRTK